MTCRKSKGKLRDNNKGVTFIELVVVVAILAIMAASATYGITMLVSADAKKASKNLYQAVSELRNDTLSQTGEWWGELKRTSGNGQYTFTIYRRDTDGNVVEKDKQQLGSKLTISVMGNGTPTVTDTDSVLVYFKPGSGTVDKVVSGVTNASMLDSTSIKFTFNIASNNGLTYKLILWTNTGKIATE